MEKKTTIQVTKSTRDKLSRLGGKGDSFDTIINKLLNQKGGENMLEFSNEKTRKGDEYTFCYDCNYTRGDEECNNCTYYND